MKELAIAKINKELAEYRGGLGEEIMKKDVAAALCDFCEQDEEFAQAVIQGGSFRGCMAAVAKGVNGSGISDLEAYKRAVQFYFPGAGIRMHMSIDLCAGIHSATPDNQVDQKAIMLNLSDFL